MTVIEHDSSGSIEFAPVIAAGVATVTSNGDAPPAPHSRQGITYRRVIKMRVSLGKQQPHHS